MKTNNGSIASPRPLRPLMNACLNPPTSDAKALHAFFQGEPLTDESTQTEKPESHDLGEKPINEMEEARKVCLSTGVLNLNAGHKKTPLSLHEVKTPLDVIDFCLELASYG